MNNVSRIFAPIKFGNRKQFRNLTEKQAQHELEIAVEKLIKTARWHGYRSKINELRRPLIQLKLARKTKAQA